MPHPLAPDLEHVLAHTADIWECFRNANVFITGGTAFVGTWLVESFVWANQRLNLNARVVLLTRNAQRWRGKYPESVSAIAGDLATFPFPKAEFDFVIHAATERGFSPTNEEPAGPFLRDIEATRRVLDFASSHGVKRLLFTSSGAVYGKQPPEMTHISEDYCGAPLTNDSQSSYGQAKRASEFLCSMYARQFGFSAVIARLFAFSGPHLPLDTNFAIGNFVRDALRGGPIQVNGDGAPLRSYLYAADLAIWLWTLLAKGESSRPYNVGSGEALSILDLAQLVVQNTVPSLEISVARQAQIAAPVSRYVPSVERAHVELGLKPLISTAEGIRRMYTFAKANAP